MNKISRRHLIQTSLLSVTTIVMAPNTVTAKVVKQHRKSALITGKTIPLPYDSIAGLLSNEQLTPHHDAHYGGALQGYFSLDKQIQMAAKTGKTLDASSYASKMRARTQKANSVLLHELYFAGMSSVKTQLKNASEPLQKAIKKRFGSMENWATDFQACAKTASGWAVLAYDQITGELYNIASDKHADGVLWVATPLIALDMYEHAYYVDYKNNKSAYIKRYMQYINWHEIDLRFSQIVL